MSKINIPAIRGYIGTFTYYITTFTFNQITTRVKCIDDELHTSNSLKEQIQRALTDNHNKIKDYILTQKEHFFNSLVLAVYDGEPKWSEMKVDFQDVDYYNMGFLQLNGEEKIFPVDGQHRVEGIKKAILENPELGEETIGAILIGHSKTSEGMEKTRRIFSTLNRYAKPVSLGDIIALDEDDIVAIVTRELLETYPLFMKDRVRATNSKALSDTDRTSFTSLITLYECHREIFKYYQSKKDNKTYSKAKIDEFLKYRRTQAEIDHFFKYLTDFWGTFCSNLKGMNEYITSDSKASAETFRNKKDGGLLYFRPVALHPLIQAIMEIHRRKSTPIKEVMEVLSKKEMIISKKPWINVLWEPVNNTMIMGNATLTRYLLMFLYDKSVLTAKEIESLKTKYAAALNVEIKDVNKLLKELK